MTVMDQLQFSNQDPTSLGKPDSSEFFELHVDVSTPMKIPPTLRMVVPSLKGQTQSSVCDLVVCS